MWAMGNGPERPSGVLKQQNHFETTVSRKPSVVDLSVKKKRIRTGTWAGEGSPFISVGE